MKTTKASAIVVLVLVMSRSNGGDGTGVYGYSTSGTGVFGEGTVGVDGEGTVAVRGDGEVWDFFAVHGTYGNMSSIRWKREIQPIDDPLAKVSALRGVYFDWDEEHGGKHAVGMIAEEVGQVLPEIVSYEENGIDATGMDYSKLTPLLVEAIKALREHKGAEITRLQEQVSDLTTRLERMEITMSTLLNDHFERAAR